MPKLAVPKIGDIDLDRNAWYVIVPALALLVLLWLLLSGDDGSNFPRDDEPSLRQQLRALEQENESLRKQLVVIEKGAEIDRMAAESVRSELVDYRRDIARLTQDIEFYRGLMAPDEADKGLGIHAFTLDHNKEVDRYYFKITVKQSGGGNPLLRGQVSVAIEGMLEGAEQPEHRDIQSLTGFEGQLPAKLRFRFFQNIEGAFKLPANYVPVSITVVAKSTGKSAQSIEQQYRWQELMGET